MMKIHTTQDLNLSVIRDKSINSTTIPNEIRYNFLENSKFRESADNFSIVAFKGKKPTTKSIKMILKAIKNGVGNIAKEASPEVKRGDNLYKSPFFRALTGISDYETVVQSTIAAIACALRALTIVGMSNEENKGNNAYAAGHALASGIVGFITVFLLTTPFKAGADHVMKNMLKDLKLSTLKRLYPQLDEKTIVNAAGERIEPKIKEMINGELVEKVQWKHKDGLDFFTDVKTCAMLPKFRKLADMSAESFEKILNVTNVDWVAQKGKSFNEVFSRDGNKLYEKIDFNKLGLVFEYSEVPVGKKQVKPVKTEVQVLFRDMNRDFFEDFIRNMDDNSIWKSLDVDSVFDGKVVRDFRQWKNKNGAQWKLDLDTVYGYSPLETYDKALRSNGTLRWDEKEGIHKIRAFQMNGKGDGLGTEITDEMLKADKESAALIKSLNWLPDLLFRIPIAMTTVALIPWILKNVFHIEKQKPQAVIEENKQQELVLNNNEINSNNLSFKGNKLNNVNSEEPESVDNISFKAGTPNKPGFFKRLTEIIGEFMGKLYGKRLIESERMAKISAILSNIPGGVTQAMATFGSLLTSATYVVRTLTNKKDFEEDKKRTLAVNQTLCFIVPTIAAYTVDRLLNGWVKKQEYRYKNVNMSVGEKLKASGQVEAGEELIKKVLKNSNGVRILASLATFTLIYRYATPVLITPIANRIGDWYNSKLKAKKQVEANENKAVA